jgi:hypothetical protein
MRVFARYVVSKLKPNRCPTFRDLRFQTNAPLTELHFYIYRCIVITKCCLPLTSLTFSNTSKIQTSSICCSTKCKNYPQNQHTVLTHNYTDSHSFYFTDFSGCNARSQTCAKAVFYSYNGASTNITINMVILPSTKHITSHNIRNIKWDIMHNLSHSQW